MERRKEGKRKKNGVEKGEKNRACLDGTTERNGVEKKKLIEQRVKWKERSGGKSEYGNE